MQNEAWLIFREGDHKLRWLFKEGYGHVSILYKDGFNWMLIAPKERELEIIILPYDAKEDAPQWIANSEYMTIYKIDYNKNTKNYLFPRFLIGFSCVSLVKYFLGYKDYSITPYKLLKNLRKYKQNIINVKQIERKMMGTGDDEEQRQLASQQGAQLQAKLAEEKRKKEEEDKRLQEEKLKRLRPQTGGAGGLFGTDTLG